MDFSPLARFGLLLMRPGIVVAIAPGIGGAHITAPVKVGLTVLLALGLMPSVPLPHIAGDLTLTAVLARELAIGLALALVVRALVTGVEFAGHLAGYQIGFSYGATIDPQSGVNNTALATLYGSLATMTFLAIDGHHMLLRALSASYGGVPVGSGGVDASLVVAVRQVLGLMFVVATRLSAPIIAVLVIVELAVGLVSRSAPALNFMVVGYPLRLVLGLVTVGALIGTIPSVTASVLESTVALAVRTASAFR